MVSGFLGILLSQFIIFNFTTIGTLGEKTFLFLTYANSFSILIGTNFLLMPFVNDNPYLQHGIMMFLLAGLHIFLYKVLLPTYRRSKVFFGNGWWKLNPVLILFLIQFLNQYAFSIVDKASARALFFDFIIFSSIFYLILVILFDLVKGDAEKNKKAFENEELKSIAYVDILTGVPNRVAYTKYTDKQKRNHRRNMGSDFVLAMLDINDFKLVNSVCGIDMGNMTIQAIWDVICANVGPREMAAHVAGDNFILYVQEVYTKKVIARIEKISAEIEALAEELGIISLLPYFALILQLPSR